MITNVYIDGFNLYYGALRGTPYKWLDVAALCRHLLPSNTIHRVRYFTARVAVRGDDQGASLRQQVYLRALATIPNLTVHLGHFLTHPTRMPLAHPLPGGPATIEVIKTEEKGSDVNLATYLLLDGFKRECQAAVVLSNDSDLKEPVTLAHTELGLTVGVVNPHPAGRRSRAFQPAFFKQIRERDLQLCQFPDVLEDGRGAIHKPATW